VSEKRREWMTVAEKPGVMERFASKYVVMPNGCWRWTSARQGDQRYGVFQLRHHKQVMAHRLAYELFAGPIPSGYQIDHLCKNTICVNPEHLEAVTPRVNTLRSDNPPARNSQKTHCKRGHPLVAENLRVSPGRRVCATCRRDYEREWARRKRASRA
jgi:hypothetical protein